MSNTTHARQKRPVAWALVATMGLGLAPPFVSDAAAAENTTVSSGQALSAKQQSIVPIAAEVAVGNIPQLNAALNHGLDAGLSVAEIKEILIQLYAYTGFPRSLNALGELMKVLDARKQRGIQDPAGREPTPLPPDSDILSLGTANQTKLLGQPARAPLYEFAPTIDDFLKRHLFGDIFARDNLDWQSRELATVGALAAMPGVESQLQAHLGFSMNVGLTAAQLREAAQVLAQASRVDAAARTRTSLEKHLAGTKR